MDLALAGPRRCVRSPADLEGPADREGLADRECLADQECLADRECLARRTPALARCRFACSPLTPTS